VGSCLSSNWNLGAQWIIYGIYGITIEKGKSELIRTIYNPIFYTTKLANFNSIQNNSKFNTKCIDRYYCN